MQYLPLEQQSESKGSTRSGAGLKWGPGLCGCESQVRLLRASKGYKCPQAPAQLFCRAAFRRERVQGKLCCDLERGESSLALRWV